MRRCCDIRTATKIIADVSAWGGSDPSVIWWWSYDDFGIGTIDAFYGDRERAVFESSYPAFFFQIPEMKLQMLPRTA